jgi:hypothetical protein
MSSLFLYASRLACAFLVALLAALLWAAAVPTAATAQTVRYVDAGAAPGGDGSSWAAAFDALPDALDAAQPGDAIWIAAGTYVPGPDRRDAFSLKDGVALLGGFAGTEARPAERTLGAAATVLSGAVDGDGAPSGNAYHVVTAPAGVTGSAVLDRLTITGGNADGTGVDGCGGGLRLDGASPTLQNVRIAGNRAVRGGGLCLTGGAAPPVANALIAENTATEAGGGAYADQGSAGAFTHVTITANAAPTGGGLYVLDSAPTVKSSIVWDNAGGSLASATSRTITFTIDEIGNDLYPGNDAPGNLEELIIQVGTTTETVDVSTGTGTKTFTIPGTTSSITITQNDVDDYTRSFGMNKTETENPVHLDTDLTNRLPEPTDYVGQTDITIPVDELESSYQVKILSLTSPDGYDTGGDFMEQFVSPNEQTKVGAWKPRPESQVIEYGIIETNTRNGTQIPEENLQRAEEILNTLTTEVMPYIATNVNRYSTVQDFEHQAPNKNYSYKYWGPGQVFFASTSSEGFLEYSRASNTLNTNAIYSEMWSSLTGIDDPAEEYIAEIDSEGDVTYTAFAKFVPRITQTITRPANIFWE